MWVRFSVRDPRTEKSVRIFWLKFENFTIIVHIKLAFESSKLRNEFGTVFFSNSRLLETTETQLSWSFWRFRKFLLADPLPPTTDGMRPILNPGLSYSNYDKWYQLPRRLQLVVMYNDRWKILQQQDPIQLRLLSSLLHLPFWIYITFMRLI